MDNIDERVAEWMGWKRGHFCWVTDKGRHIDVTEWQPSKRIEQAWMIFEQLEGDWQLNAVGGKYMLWQEKTLGPWADTAPMAICLAALEATGGGA